MNLLENIKFALLSIKSNMLRAILTLLIIAFGIMALVGILTAIDSIIYSMSSSFSSLGSNSFSIERAASDFDSRQDGEVRKVAEVISYDQAQEFKDRYNFPAMVSISFPCKSNAVIQYKDEETNPTTPIFAVDENFLFTSGNNLKYGRFFQPREALSTSRIAVIGYNLAENLYPSAQEAINKPILIDDTKMTVIGVLALQGSSMNQNSDRTVLIPLLLGKQLYGTASTAYDIKISLEKSKLLSPAISQAIGLMRSVRDLRTREKNDFEITKSNAIINIIKENTVSLRLGAIIIGIMTLLGAAIGLMNIMLVSVTERTREIGIIKAIGATQTNIRIQFLTEAVVISLIGGIIGIFLGILAGNGVSYLTGSAFIMPWNWITIALILCIITGIVSGLYPAIKASRLDPIESLRYE